jgi:predicted phosphohydrolase
MKIQYASDLHLEFTANKTFVAANPLLPKADILILAGDIVLLREAEKHADFFNYLADNFKAVYWIPGNHEYYQCDIANMTGTFCESIRSNVFLLNNTTVTIDDVNLVFSTLWSKISEANRWSIQSGLNDFRLIKLNKQPFTAELYNQLYQENAEFLSTELTRLKGQKTVVTTHHVPTFFNYPAQYKGDALNEAFATELFNFITETQPHAWIYGHHHQNTPKFTIGKTKLLTNQLGYVQHNENHSFNTQKIVDL